MYIHVAPAACLGLNSLTYKAPKGLFPFFVASGPALGPFSCLLVLYSLKDL